MVVIPFEHLQLLCIFPPRTLSGVSRESFRSLQAVFLEAFRSFQESFNTLEAVVLDSSRSQFPEDFHESLWNILESFRSPQSLKSLQCFRSLSGVSEKSFRIFSGVFQESSRSLSRFFHDIFISLLGFLHSSQKVSIGAQGLKPFSLVRNLKK